MAIYLITGASSGIGAELARQLCESGQTVYGLARRGEKLAEMDQKYPERFLAYPCDVTQPEQVKNVCARLPQLPDVAILSAGIGDFDSPETIDLDVHTRTFATNYFGVLHFMAELFPAMKQRGSGKFVAISSLAGYRGLPDGAAYGASKGAISIAVESFRLTYGKCGVDFIAVHPGFVATPMTAKNKEKMPFLWSADRAASYILAGIKQGKLNIDFPWPLRLGIGIIRLLPADLYRRLMARKAD